MITNSNIVYHISNLISTLLIKNFKTKVPVATGHGSLGASDIKLNPTSKLLYLRWYFSLPLDSMIGFSEKLPASKKQAVNDYIITTKHAHFSVFPPGRADNQDLRHILDVLNGQRCELLTVSICPLSLVYQALAEFQLLSHHILHNLKVST